MTKYTKMLTLVIRTVRKSVLLLALTVFFPSMITAGDSSLISLEAGISELIYQLSRSLVTVESFGRVSSSAGISPGDATLRSLVASGLIVDSSGHILVAAESVAGCDRILVGFDNRRVPAQLVAVDHVNMLALLRTNQRFGCPVTYSDLHTCAGQMVVAMGNAYGLRASPYMGMCAGVREDGRFQFSMPVSSGAVGGGVFDFSGRLLGMVIGGIGQQDRVAVAFPAHKLAGAVDYMRVNGDRFAGFVGIRTSETEINPPLRLAPTSALMLTGGAQNNVLDAGVLVTSVISGSPASLAGIRRGDLIYAIGNKRVRNVSDLSSVVRRCEPGMIVNIELVRQRASRSISLTIGRRQLPSVMQAASFDDYPIEQRRVADSISGALNILREEVSRLERRLQGID
jgi:S1-C subfamily serine protease